MMENKEVLTEEIKKENVNDEGIYVKRIWELENELKKQVEAFNKLKEETETKFKDIVNNYSKEQPKQDPEPVEEKIDENDPKFWF